MQLTNWNKRGYQTLSFLMTVLLIITFSVSNSVSVKAEVQPAQIVVENKTVTAGNSVNIGVMANNLPTPGLAGYDFLITYDPNIVSVNGITITDPSAFAAPMTNTSVAGQIHVTAAQANGAGPNISLFNINFQAIGQIGQSTQLTVINGEFVDSNLMDIPFQISSGSIAIQNSNPSPQLNLLTTALPNGTVNQPYKNTDQSDVHLMATGGVSPYVWNVISGLPSGLVLGSDGLLAGIPTVTGTFAFKFSVTDSANTSNTYTIPLVINPQQLNSSMLQIDNQNIAPGSNGVVGVHALNLPDPHGLAGYDFTIHYDPLVLDITGVTGTNEFAAPTYNKIAGELHIVAAQSSGVSGNVLLFNLNVSALTNAASTTQISLTVKDFSSDLLANIPYTIVGGTVTVQQGTNVPVTGVTLNNTSTTIQVGAAHTLTATVSPDNASDKTVTWTSSDASVATVNNGVVTGVAPGTATIIVASNADPTITATCTVIVDQQLAQNGSLAGIVSQPTLGAVINANVSIVGTAFTVKTGQDGNYLINNVPAGVYTITIEENGYVNLTIPNVTVVGGQTTNINSTLVMYGDVNGDGAINVSDATEVMRYFVKGIALTYPDAADVNKDGSINVSDATAIMKYFVKNVPF